ncbi:MAG: hypothetical protein ACI81L_003208 [Verrucomicrobiales bacterium]|jgi:hypothetical protein
MIAGAAAAQTPEPVAGEVVVIPFSTNVQVDGDLTDWANIDVIITNDGPEPSLDPSTTGEMQWQVAADAESLYFAATITDTTIIAGQHGDNYWNEDSIELYLNFSGTEFATTYGPGIGQITISAVDIGNTDPTLLTLSGNGASGFDVTGFVFSTHDGWGLEIAVGLVGVFELVSGEDFGLQVQANGSSGGDRDLKLNWSAADVSDTSFRDPSVFGTAIAFDPPGAREVVEPTSAAELPTGDADAGVGLEEQAVVEDPPATQPSNNDGDPQSGRALLIAAVISSATILLGGIWFEQRRKKSEQRLGLSAANSSDAPPGLESIFDDAALADGVEDGGDDAHP